MTKEDFIIFINQLDFIESWQSNPNQYFLFTDRLSQNAYTDQLCITLDDENGIAQLYLSQMVGNMAVGKNFGNFSLKTFGQKDDFQLEIFMSFVKGSFDKLPNTITQYMRDMKIKDILND